MSSQWRDRDDSRGDENPFDRYGRPGGDWQGIRPSFDNPATWAVSVGRIAGVEIRIHILFLLFIIVMLIRAGTIDAIGIGLMALLLGILFGIVLLHEFGHVFGCRSSGGEANEILMWPLGGLAYVRPRQNWRSHLISAAAGPMVNLIICLCTGLLLGLLTGRWLGIALPNPLYFANEMWGPTITTRPLAILFLINSLSLLLLLFNLLPIFPLDGGRIVQAALWPRFGYVRSMRFAVRTGYVGALLLAVFGAVFTNLWLLAIAIFGAVTCYMTHKQLQFTEEMMGFTDGSDEYALQLAYGETECEDGAARPNRAERRAAKQRVKEEQEAAEVDRILQKIASSGMGSLTRNERKLLDRVSARKRGG